MLVCLSQLKHTRLESVPASRKKKRQSLCKHKWILVGRWNSTEGFKHGSEGTDLKEGHVT
jgi:hypothetical protein